MVNLNKIRIKIHEKDFFKKLNFHSPIFVNWKDSKISRSANVQVSNATDFPTHTIRVYITIFVVNNFVVQYLIFPLKYYNYRIFVVYVRHRVVSPDYVGGQGQFKHCKNKPYLSQAENRVSVSWH
jgi:hypothetical protein